LNPKEFEIVACTLMNLIDGADVSLDAINRLFAYAGSLLNEILFHTPEGALFRETLTQEFISNKAMQSDALFIALLSFIVLCEETAHDLLDVASFGHKYFEIKDSFTKYIVDPIKYDLYASWGIGPSPYTTTGNDIASRNEQLVVDTDVLSACASQLRQLQGKANEISKDLKLAFGAKRGYQSDSDIIIGGIVDTFHRDWSDLEAAQSSLSEAAKGMKHIAKALDSMRGFLEDAETTATKYGRSGG